MSMIQEPSRTLGIMTLTDSWAQEKTNARVMYMLLLWRPHRQSKKKVCDFLSLKQWRQECDKARYLDWQLDNRPAGCRAYYSSALSEEPETLKLCKCVNPVKKKKKKKALHPLPFSTKAPKIQIFDIYLTTTLVLKLQIRLTGWVSKKPHVGKLRFQMNPPAPCKQALAVLTKEQF